MKDFDWQAYFGTRPAHKRELSEINRLLSKLGNPQQSYANIHIAGTNGKGSTSTMIASILRAAGYRVGLYTSPALARINERININGLDISDCEFMNLAVKVRQAETELRMDLGGFDRMTVAALLAFSNKVDVAVLETGLGGRLDPTSAVFPVVSVITHVGLDHMQLLGNTLAEIAREKCGILKAGVPLVVHRQEPEAMAVIEEYARAENCNLIRADSVNTVQLSCGNGRQRFAFQFQDQREEYETRLLGAHQIDNAASAILTAKELIRQGYRITNGNIREGIKEAFIPCRMEIVDGILLDGAHNPQAVEALRDAVQSCFPGKKIVLITAIMCDKDINNIVKIFSGFVSNVITICISRRGLDAGELAGKFRANGIEAAAAAEVETALDWARKLDVENKLIVAAGSLYLASAVRETILNDNNK